METYILDESERLEWNTFVAAEKSFALQQSWEWGEYKNQLGWKAARVAVKDGGRILAGAQVLIKPLPLHLASFAYVPRGPMGDWLEEPAVSLLMEAVHRVARRHRAVFLKIEPPLSDLPAECKRVERMGFRRSPRTNQPRATIMVDLNRTDEEILAGMHKNTRRKIKDAARKGMTTRVGTEEDFPEFYRLMQATGNRSGFPVRDRSHYLTEWKAFVADHHALLLLGYFQDRLLIADLVYGFGKHAAFFHQASSGELSQMNPNTFMVWQLIQWAKQQGYETFDLWGIPDEIGDLVAEGEDAPEFERTDGLWGVYKFKRGFSKRIVRYIGALDFVYQPLLYPLTANPLMDSGMLEQLSIWMDILRFRLNPNAA